MLLQTTKSDEWWSIQISRRTKQILQTWGPDNTQDTYKAAEWTGHQPDVWVLGDNLQIMGDRNLANKEDTLYVCVKNIIEVEDPIQGDSSSFRSIILPLNSLTLGDFVKQLIGTLHQNGMAGIFTIGTYNNI